MNWNRRARKRITGRERLQSGTSLIARLVLQETVQQHGCVFADDLSAQTDRVWRICRAGTLFKTIFSRCSPVSEDVRSLSPGASIDAWTDCIHANAPVRCLGSAECTAPFMALLTRFEDNPLLPTIDEFRMIEAPSGRSGRAFGTVKSVPLPACSD